MIRQGWMHRNYIKICFLSLTANTFNNQVAKYTAGVNHLEWREVESGKLPQPRGGLRAAMVDNVVYVTGGYDDDDFFTSMSSWDPTNESWEEAGNLVVRRGSHGAVAVPSSMIESGCLTTTQIPTLIQKRAPTLILTPIPTQTPPTSPLTPVPRQGPQP